MNNIAKFEKRDHIILFLIICFILSGVVMYANQVAHAHFVKPAEDDIGPVCGMPLDKDPEWASVIMFKDGKHVKLHGPKHMFVYYFNVAKYDSRHDMSDISTMHVIDYYSRKNIKAREAYYVLGCNVTGPMGDDLIPLKDRTSAGKFREKHGGEILSFDEITPEVIYGLKNIIPDDSRYHLPLYSRVTYRGSTSI